jgi:hypothetical protein
MPYIHLHALEYERRRWLRPDAHRFIRRDWRRFVKPGSELAAYYESIERKYRAGQPRVPRGNPDGGQWASGGGGVDNGPNSSDRNPEESNTQVAQLFPSLVRPLPFLSKPPVVPRPVIEPPIEPAPLIEPPIEPSPLIKPPLEEWPTNPREAPPGYEWNGRPGSTPEDGQGAYVKRGPNGGKESLRYDDTTPGHKPHWDYRAPDKNWYRWYPDGTIKPKNSNKPMIIFRLET